MREFFAGLLSLHVLGVAAGPVLTPEARDHFETPPATSGWPEVGSRTMQRMAVAFAAPGISPWVEVQAGRYRYLAVAVGAVLIRMVISEYLACEVIWSQSD